MSSFLLFPQVADPGLWKRQDYRAVPFEILATFWGDCQHIFFGKYADYFAVETDTAGTVREMAVGLLYQSEDFQKLVRNPGSAMPELG